MKTPHLSLAALLLASLVAAAPARAGVPSLRLGITMACPYGLAG